MDKLNLLMLDTAREAALEAVTYVEHEYGPDVAPGLPPGARVVVIVRLVQPVRVGDWVESFSAA